jgi:hypothetical protein
MSHIFCLVGRSNYDLPTYVYHVAGIATYTTMPGFLVELKSYWPNLYSLGICTYLKVQYENLTHTKYAMIKSM